MNNEAAYAGVLVSALVAAVPLCLIRIARDNARERGESARVRELTMLQFRLLVGAAMAVIAPSMFSAVLLYAGTGLNRQLVDVVVVAVAWLPALAFGLVATLMCVFGVECLNFTPSDDGPAGDQLLALRWLAWSVVLVSMGILIVGPWSMDDLTTIAKEYSVWHFGWSVVVVAAAAYAVAPIWRRIWD